MYQMNVKSTKRERERGEERERERITQKSAETNLEIAREKNAK